MPTREDAWKLLAEYVSSESLRKHCLAVEAALRAYARQLGEDEEKWGVAGLLHDFDYEKYPVPNPETHTGHPFAGEKILRERGYPEEIIRAIQGHATYSGVLRDTPMAKCLFAVDELCGFVMACAYMRPDRFATMTPESVEKNLKKKGFAAKINRAEIDQGITELGIDRAEHIQLVIAALGGIASELGF
ncbi:MAG: HDIG domain-containing protein [Candidatus Liptonbacteria bacterium]|nr:HDIG domain-containing protein [Candidatus Liptonbacteria bacterium]